MAGIGFLGKRLKEKCGLALVETAIVMLLLIFITFGIMEYSSFS